MEQRTDPDEGNSFSAWVYIVSYTISRETFVVVVLVVVVVVTLDEERVCARTGEPVTSL